MDGPAFLKMLLWAWKSSPLIKCRLYIRGIPQVTLNEVADILLINNGYKDGIYIHQIRGICLFTDALSTYGYVEIVT